MKNIDLNTTKIKSGFKTPDDYFEKFEARILEKIPAQETKVVSLFHRKQIWVSSIAAVLLLAIAIPSYFNSIKTPALDNSNIENYLSYQSNFTNFDIIENLNDDDIKELENSLTVNSQEDVEAYLLDTQNLDYYLNE
ncbi:hypothetical protein [Flavobacterium sp.]|jgi:hypothetical protein|uniref:hypothetical protein n=1 Tax=Flavobacterium sp. TaxID=239 RepID=UPI002A7FE4EB|nr:hypothetical protein [Flavobacterium sp.]